VDFGDILKKWENGSYSSSKNVMDKWLHNNKIYDKDAEAQKMSNPGENRRRLFHTRPDAVMDIHELSSEEAWVSLDVFFANAKERGYEKLRIIHGKGNHSQNGAVLKSTVQKYIEMCPFAGESGYEKAKHGGSGATWVLLKY